MPLTFREQIVLPKQSLGGHPLEQSPLVHMLDSSRPVLCFVRHQIPVLLLPVRLKFVARHHEANGIQHLDAMRVDRPVFQSTPELLDPAPQLDIRLVRFWDQAVPILPSILQESFQQVVPPMPGDGMFLARVVASHDGPDKSKFVELSTALLQKGVLRAIRPLRTDPPAQRPILAFNEQVGDHDVAVIVIIVHQLLVHGPPQDIGDISVTRVVPHHALVGNPLKANRLQLLHTFRSHDLTLVQHALIDNPKTEAALILFVKGRHVAMPVCGPESLQELEFFEPNPIEPFALDFPIKVECIQSIDLVW